MSVAVGKELPYQREGANSEDLFAVAVMTASYRRSRKISAVCSMHSTRGTILSMLDGSRRIFLSIYWICGSNTLCSASSACQQEIFGGRNFCGNKFSWPGVWITKIVKISALQKFPAIRYQCHNLDCWHCLVTLFCPCLAWLSGCHLMNLTFVYCVAN